MPLTNDGVFIDRNSFDAVWNLLIEPTIVDYSNRFAEICVAHNANEAIWDKYLQFNKHCKENYMVDPHGKLDRHKVCSCYIYAILRANVLSCKLADSDTEHKYLSLNENLAITVGLSLLRAFILSSINSSADLSPQKKSELASRIENGITLPKCNHGDYRSNFIAELHYTHEENRYNILSLANTLYLLEVFSLKEDTIHRQT